jgi:hypothetical protein
MRDPNTTVRRGLSERKRKEKKAKLLSFAFFRFALVFGIGPFQWVTSEKSEKNFPLSPLAHEVAG